jgi:hypothetical protein
MNGGTALVAQNNIDNSSDDFVFGFTIGNSGRSSERYLLDENVNEIVVENELGACDCSFDGAVFHSGFADLNGWIMDILSFKVVQENIPVESIDTIKFNFVSAGGGRGAEQHGGVDDTRDDMRLVILDVDLLDAHGECLGIVKKEVYSYDTTEYISQLNPGDQVVTFRNPNFHPEEGLLLPQITVSDLIKDAGIADSTQVKYIGFSLYSEVMNVYLQYWTGMSEDVWVSLGIEGIPWDLSTSPTQTMSLSQVPASHTLERQPMVQGSIKSTGGPITGVWCRYASAHKSDWEAATPTDGAFDSASEAFTYRVSRPLEDGEHTIEIKALNTNGEQEAVYYTYRFWIGEGGINTIVSNLNNLRVFPNPYKPGSNTSFDRRGGIVFSHLTQDALLRIYTITGELVFETSIENGKGFYEWNAYNDSGNALASGVYVYVITNSNNEKKSGKLAIIK